MQDQMTNLFQEEEPDGGPLGRPHT